MPASQPRIIRSLGIRVAILMGLAGFGACVIHWLRGSGWIESLYLAFITLSTLGSRDVAVGPHSDALMIFMMVYVVLGLSTFAFLAADIGRFILNTEFSKLIERHRMDRSIATLRNHFIVCGMGRMGTSICQYLSDRKQPFVVIDKDEALLQSYCGPRGWLYEVGDATSDADLRRAGIIEAKALATALQTDADNIYVVLSARLLSSKIQIVARASEESASEKMQRAGATRVISPFSSGAVKMARFMISPSVEDFLEITDKQGGELELADVQIRANSRYLGKKLADTDLRERGVMVIGIRRANGEKLLPPPGTAVILEGDSLFAFGSSAAVNAMIGDVSLTGK
jgi:voltage-gated potassium channel